MKVVLTQDIDTGDKWDVVDVSDGYARNYLLPFNKALPANAKNLKTIEELKKQQSKKIEQQKQEVEQLKSRVDKMDPITISVKAGEKGKLFGSVTHADIVAKIQEVSGIELEKKRLQTRSLKEAGKYDISIKLPFGMHTSITVIVEADISEHSEEIVDMREVLHKKRRRRPRKKDEETSQETEGKEVEEKEKEEATEVVEEEKDDEVQDTKESQAEENKSEEAVEEGTKEEAVDEEEANADNS